MVWPFAVHDVYIHLFGCHGCNIKSFDVNLILSLEDVNQLNKKRYPEKP